VFVDRHETESGKDFRRVVKITYIPRGNPGKQRREKCSAPVPTLGIGIGMDMNSMIYILTDFGNRDTYVAQMKAVLLSLVPAGTGLVDMTHEVPRGDVLRGAFHLWVFSGVVAPGSVVLAVVDPGVGTDRRAVACLAKDVFYVGPDNGLFGLLPLEKAWLLPDPEEESSRTFHGRDVFAPAAGRLAADPGWADHLDVLDPESMVRTVPPLPATDGDELEATVAHVDHFGNVVLWLPSENYSEIRPREVIPPGGGVHRLSPAGTYGEAQGLLFLKGSQGCMEIALGGGDASKFLRLSPGDRVRLRMEKR